MTFHRIRCGLHSLRAGRFLAAMNVINDSASGTSYSKPLSLRNADSSLCGGPDCVIIKLVVALPPSDAHHQRLLRWWSLIELQRDEYDKKRLIPSMAI